VRVVATLFIALTSVVCGTALSQEIRIYSEFERIDPFGNPVPADRVEGGR